MKLQTNSPCDDYTFICDTCRSEMEEWSHESLECTSVIRCRTCEGNYEKLQDEYNLLKENINKLLQ